MKRAAQATRRLCSRAPSATYAVRFSKKPRQRVSASEPQSLGRIPRVTHLLALAHNIDGMIRSGEIRDWADAARLVGVTRARMTQIANLLLLSPEIQEAILSLPLVVQGRDNITERELRAITTLVDWRRQEAAWAALPRPPGPPMAE